MLYNELQQYRDEAKGYISTVEKAIKESFTVPGLPSGQFVRECWGWGHRGAPAAHLLKEVDIFTRQARVEVWNARQGSQQSVSGLKAKMERFTVVGGEDKGGGVIDPSTASSKNC